MGKTCPKCRDGVFFLAENGEKEGEIEAKQPKNWEKEPEIEEIYGSFG